MHVNMQNYYMLRQLSHKSKSSLTVYLNKKDATCIAIKTVPLNHPSWYNESGILKLLADCENVPRYLWHTKTQAHIHIATEYIHGVTLELVINELNMRPSRLRGYLRQLVETMVRVHDKSIMHGDLKPENIMVTHPTRTEASMVYIVDWEYAIEVDKIDTLLCYRAGTLIYASPERMEPNTPIDIKDDCWSIGVVIYETMTGLNPYASATTMKELMKIIHDPSRIDLSLPVFTDLFKDLISNILTPRETRYTMKDIANHAWWDEPISHTSTMHHHSI